MNLKTKEPTKRKWKVALIGILVMGLLFCSVRPSEALFGTLTIEDLMERYGITRMDRIEDMLYNAQKIHELVIELPTQFTSANLTSLLGVDAVKNLPKELESYKEVFHLDLNLWDWLTGKENKTTAAGVMHNKASAISEGGAEQVEKFRNKANKDNIKVNSDINKNNEVLKRNLGKDYVDINALARGVVKDTYGDKYTKGMEQLDPSMLPAAEGLAVTGILAQPLSYSPYYMKRDISHYTDKIAEEQLLHIVKLQAEADAIKELMKKEVGEGTQKILDTLSKDGVKMTGGNAGMAWKSTASSLAASGAMQNITQKGYLYLQDMLRIKIQIKAQTSALLLSDYANFCYKKMENYNVIDNIEKKNLFKN